MEVLIFDAWLLIIILLVFVAFWRKNAVFLLVSGLLTIAFGSALTFDGLRIVNGVDKATGGFTYLTLLPTNDQLLAVVAIVTLPLGIALALFSLVVLYTDLIRQYRLWEHD